MEKADFNQLMQLRNPLVNAAENFARKENLTPVLIPTMSKEMDEQLKRAHKEIGNWRSGPSKQKDLCDSAAV